MPDTHANRVEDGIGNRRRGGHQRRLTNPFSPGMISRQIGQIDRYMCNLRNVGHGGNFVFFQIGIEHQSTFDIHHATFRQRVANALRYATNHLAFDHRWVDNAAAIVGGSDAQDGYLAGLHIYLYLYTLGAKGAHRLILGIGAPRALA